MKAKLKRMTKAISKNQYLSAGFHLIKNQVRKQFELLFWITGVLLLFFMEAGTAQPSLCLFRFAGFDSCPGCGLGHSMHHALHLRFTQSFHEHLFGIPALGIIFFRIKQLFYPIKTPQHEV